MSAERHGLEVLLNMAAAPRRRRPVLAAAVAVVAVALIVVPLVAVANDGVSHDDDHALLQAAALESMLLAGWMLTPTATLCLLGVRPRGATDYLFARVPGARLWLAYLISLAFTGIAAAVVAIVFGAALSTPQDLSDADGSREAFGWLLIRAAFFMVGGFVLCGVGLAVAAIAQVVTTTVLSRQGAVGRDELARARFLVGLLILVLLVVALPISMFLPSDPTRRLMFSGATAGAVILTAAALWLIALRASRRAKATGTPDWTHGIVRTRLRPRHPPPGSSSGSGRAGA